MKCIVIYRDFRRITYQQINMFLPIDFKNSDLFPHVNHGKAFSKDMLLLTTLYPLERLWVQLLISLLSSYSSITRWIKIPFKLFCASNFYFLRYRMDRMVVDSKNLICQSRLVLFQEKQSLIVNHCFKNILDFCFYISL